MNRNDIKRAAALAALFLVAVAGIGWNIWLQNRLQHQADIIDGLSGQLSDERSEVQRFNRELGLAQAIVASREQLIEQYKSEISALNMKLDGIRGAARLKPVARDQVTVPLSAEISGGTQTSTSTVAPSTGDQPGTTVSYEWADPTGRFALRDPDISISGDEQFSYRTKLRITGYLLSDPDGKIQARQVVAQEQYMVDGKNELGPPIPLEQNIIEYVPEAQDAPELLDILRPRAYAMVSTSGKLGLGLEIANLGHYLEYANVGVGVNIATAGTSIDSAISNADIGITATYWGLPPIVSTNIAVGVGITTPAVAPGSQVGVTGNVLFYINN